MRFKSSRWVPGGTGGRIRNTAPAQAAVITKGISGIVTSADANPLDLKVDDILTGFVTFDSGLLTGVGIEFLTLDRDPGLRIHIEIGTLRFDETDEEEFRAFRESHFWMASSWISTSSSTSRARS